MPEIKKEYLNLQMVGRKKAKQERRRSIFNSLGWGVVIYKGLNELAINRLTKGKSFIFLLSFQYFPFL